MSWALAAVCAVATVPSGLRWLRVAQREHYLAFSATRFARRWWGSSPINLVLVFVSTLGLCLTFWIPGMGLLVPITQVGPIGLSVRGRTTPLAWTARLRRVAVVAGILVLSFYVIGALMDSVFLVALGLFLLPGLIDVALLVLRPLERHLGNRWVDQAATRLRTSGARVVAITGSYGKTTTKQYVAHLLSPSLRTVASPASFNNRLGLARALNEHLVPGTEVFVAEMGTYGPGEIAELCEWIRPTVSAIVAIGPVHLERFKTVERILSAKGEILDRAEVGVIGVDNPLLARLAVDRSMVMNVITASGKGAEAKVSVKEGLVYVDGVAVAPLPANVFPVNLAVAIGIALALGLEPADISARFADLPSAEHRQTVSRSDRGFSIIDDTFNSNPDGARSGLSHLSRLGGRGRKVVVTPGMVELGALQFEENRQFAAEAGEVADDLVIVGGTNRRALLDGSGRGRASVTVVGSREEAVDWARQNLGPGDTILYENDLPDHYP